ncbi:MAG: hypothetical protein E6J90_05335 [Deltaproteobacteria bacterium]|nr:MAG: hypothetical protein E6J90_05335 [Deltaproteobacteria bacterium]
MRGHEETRGNPAVASLLDEQPRDRDDGTGRARGEQHRDDDGDPDLLRGAVEQPATEPRAGRADDRFAVAGRHLGGHRITVLSAYRTCATHR